MIHFLRTVFGVGKNHRMFHADVLRWKCLTPHPFWEGSRGYALRYKGNIAAFGCLVPCRFLTGSATVPGCNMIDWAASKSVPGAGLMLYKHIHGLVGTMINTGGTDDARQVLPRMGFQARAELQHCTRVLRPWRHLRQSRLKDWKSPLRLARDYKEVTRHVGPALAVRRIESFAGVPGDVFPDPAITRQVVFERTAESLDYFLACPAARMEAYLFERNGSPAGYFLLSRVGHQCRIADLWVRSAERPDWEAAYAAATMTAGEDLGTTEVRVGASVIPTGYRRMDSEPVFVLDPKALLAGRGDLALSYLENDAFYWAGSAD